MPGNRPRWDENSQSWQNSSGQRSPARPPRPGTSVKAGRRTVWATVSAAAVAAVVTTLILVRLPDDGSSGHAASPAAPSPSATKAANVLPDGFRRVRDKEGFTTAVPEQWKRSTPEPEPNGTFIADYDHPDSSVGSYLRVTDAPGSSPKELIDAGWEGSKALASPRRLNQGHASGYLQTFRSEDGESSTVEIAFTAEDGKVYDIAVFGASPDLARHRKIARTAMRHFCPAGEQCGP